LATNATQPFWAVSLTPYVRDVGVFKCPSHAGTPVATLTNATTETYYAAPFAVSNAAPPVPPNPHTIYVKTLPAVGYGFNRLVLTGVFCGSSCGCCETPKPTCVGDIKQPALIAVLGDGNCLFSPVYTRTVATMPYLEMYWAWQNNTPPQFGRPMHATGSNFAFADGHVQFGLPSALSSTAAIRGFYPTARLW
jgi:prepilin-type processing-associated H-X9-DG protein